MRDIRVPYRQARSPATFDAWRVKVEEGTAVLPEAHSNWDPSVDLEVSRTTRLDGARLRDECALPEGAVVRLLAGWQSENGRSKNFPWRHDLLLPGEFHGTIDLRISGARTAEKQYGARGWVLHHNTDLWRGTAPINNIDGVWPTGGAWLCYHLWEHYLYTGDKAFLENRAYPALREASLFFVDFLVKHPTRDWLVTVPSHSPEQGPLTAGPAMDMQLIRALFDATTEAAGALGRDAEFVSELKRVRSRLVPDQVGKHGQLQEWLDDVDVPNNNHRHMSPLWGLYPGAQFTPANAETYEAAKVLLKWRGDGSTGWSYAWRIPLWARVGDGEAAYRQFALQLGRKTLPNLFDLCGPYQIDGNFGAPAGVAEMLLQSHVRTGPEAFCIDALPALPSAWPKGKVTGLKARGGFEVDMAWDAGKLTRIDVRSSLGRPCEVRYAGKTIDVTTRPGGAYAFDGQLRELR